MTSRLTKAMRSRGGVSLLGLGVLALVPITTDDPYTLGTFVLALIYVIVVAGWDLITGYAGIFSFGQVAFFVVGAYGSAMLSLQLGLSPWLTMVFGAGIAAAVGVGIGLPCLRIRGAYVALVTYALALLLPTFILFGDRFGTGGAAGLFGVPGLSIGEYRFSPLDPTVWFYTALGLAAISVYAIYFGVMNSRLGLAMTALRDADTLVKSLGVNENAVKLIVFALSAFFTGLAGAFYVHYVGGISQKTLGLDFFILLMVMLFVGGLARYPGAVVGALVFTFVNQYLNALEQYRMIVLGVLVVLSIEFMPQGFVAALEDLAKWLRRKRVAGATTVVGGTSSSGSGGPGVDPDGRLLEISRASTPSGAEMASVPVPPST